MQPLLWAVLIGSLLHPAKDALTWWTRNWLLDVRASHSLLSVSVALLPLHFLDTTSEVVGRFVYLNLYLLHGKNYKSFSLLLKYVMCMVTPTQMQNVKFVKDQTWIAFNTEHVFNRFVVRHVRSVVTVTVILPLFYIIIHHTPTFLSTLAYTLCSATMSVITVIVSVVTYNGYVVSIL